LIIFQFLLPQAADISAAKASWKTFRFSTAEKPCTVGYPTPQNAPKPNGPLVQCRFYNVQTLRQFPEVVKFGSGWCR